jgi:cytochrome c oxidase assembly protein subunit 15
VNHPSSARTQDTDIALSVFAKLVVVFTFAVIFVGGHTTTAGAGMAFPDWPLSHGSVNPHGWWEDLMQRLEHGHRILAETTGLLVGILCAWVWRSKWSLPLAIGVSLLLAVSVYLAGASRPVVAHAGLWSAALIFAVAFVLGARGRSDLRRPALRWLAFAGFLGICVQALMGGLRVVIETGGDVAVATAFRVLHGCFAQLELCLLVALAAMLSPAWRHLDPRPHWPRLARLGWFAAAVIFLQLVVGATMRHLGAGLAIASFPQAAPGGSWFPTVSNGFVHLNFTHTRVGALIVTALVLLLAFRRRGRVAACCGGLRCCLCCWSAPGHTRGAGHLAMRPPFLTTMHVVNGAALLATTVLLAVRAGKSPARAEETKPRSEVFLEEVHA